MRLRNFTTLLFILLFAFSSNYTFAQAAGRITFKNVDSLVYDVSVVLYRHCQGVGLPSTWPINITTTSHKLKVNVKASRKSIEQISPTCSSLSPPCSPANGPFAGDGYEQQEYVIRVDFTDSKYDTFVKMGEPIWFEMYHCCRPSIIDNGGSGDFYYNYAWLDLKQGDNSSAQPSSKPIILMCADQPYYYDLGIDENDDGDSISCTLVNPLKDYNKTISTSVPPLEPYYPVGLKYPYSSPKSNPPIGLYLDNGTGSLVMTPVGIGETGIVVIEVTTWKKDSAGKYQKSTMIRQDEIIGVRRCASNNPPQISTNTIIDVCIGDTAKTSITTSDKVKVPPPPATKPDPDTVSVAVLNPIDGATYTYSSDTILLQSVEFKWVPKDSDARAQPYQFTVKAQDNACPLNAIVYKTVQVFVHPKPQAETMVKDLSCNAFEVQCNAKLGYSAPFRYNWSLLDTQGKELGIDNAYFVRSSSSTSTGLWDTLYIRKKGTYILQQRIVNKGNCEILYFDTITVKSDLPQLFSKRDFIVCKSDSTLLKQDLVHDTLIVDYQWSDGLKLGQRYIKYKTVSSLYLRANAKDGCFYFDDVKLNDAEKPKLTVSPDSGWCLPFTKSIHVNVANPYTFDPHKAVWSNTKTTDTISVSQGGQYRVAVTNSCGTSRDTVNISGWQKPQVNLDVNPTFFCDTSLALLQSGLANPEPLPKYTWDDKSSSPTRKITTQGKYSLTVDNQCGTSIDTIEINELFYTPFTRLPSDTILCDGKPVELATGFDKSATTQWSTGESSTEIKINGVDKVWVEVSNGCGSITDTVYLSEKSSPRREMPADTFFCDGDVFYLDAGNLDGSYTYVWDGKGQKTRRLRIDSTDTYSVYIQNECGALSVATKVEKKHIPVVDLGADSIIRSESFELDAGNPGSTYLWNTGLREQKQTIQVTGWYWVDVTNECGTTRDSIFVGIVGVNQLARNEIKVFPNPTTGMIRIRTINSIEDIRVQAFSTLGVEISGLKVNRLENEISVELPSKNQLVFLKLSQGDKRITVPIVVVTE